jgi:aspartate/methionine/tyrosine aminotransferase
MEKLSTRAQQMGAGASKLLNTFILVQKNSYDDKLNPNGICNCGVAENYLCENELISKLQSIQAWKTNHMYYPNPLGQIRLREVLCRFFQRIFQLNSQLDPNRMIISSGLGGIISLLGYLLGDENDVFLIPSPYYTAFDHDISAFSNCTIFRCPLLEQDNGNFRFSVEIFKRGYNDAINKGLRPRGIIIINPSNPLGDIYDEETIEPVLKFAAEKELHVIIDEIYSLSLFENQKSFQSVLNYTSIVDQERTHFVWSISKDFALSGLRLGVVYAGSKDLCIPGAGLNFIQVPSTIVQEIIAELLFDDQWIDYYIELNRSRLTKQYEIVKKKIEDIDNRIYIRPSKAGFFIWADFRLLLHKITFEEETRLFETMFNHGIYISSGYNLGCSQPGWFRMIFSIKEKWIDESIKRLKIALDAYRHLTIPTILID